MTDQTPADPNAAPPAVSPYGAEPVQEPSKAKAVGGAIVKKIIGLVIAFVVVSGAYYVYNVVTGDVSTAKVGDCITESVESDASDAKVVDCTKPEAKNKVAGIVENKFTRAQFMAEDAVCPDFATATSAIFLGESSGTGDVWCLEPIK